MAQVIGYDVFRTLRACRQIEETNTAILNGLHCMRRDTNRTRDALREAGRRLEETLGHFNAAQERLSQANEQHARVMRVVDEIMERSEVFRALR